MFFSQLFNFTIYHFDVIISSLVGHLALVIVSLALSIVIALPLGFALSQWKKLSTVVLSIFSVIYSIPSLSLLSFFVPITGLGFNTAIIALFFYSQFILLRNVITGFSSVDKAELEAGRGMGLNVVQMFFWVELPLAAPTVISGIRIATVSTIGIATIAASINAGGIGVLIFNGILQMDFAKMFWGAVLSSGLALFANQILSDFERVALLKTKGQLIEE
ncbi:MAG: ABC transporter permease [Sporolactobacillus sp.]